MLLKQSEEQLKVEEAIRNTQSNICVQATAGAGKTTTILRCLEFVPKFKRTIFLSFSNGIVKELKNRVPSGIQASTLHSLGFREIMKKWGQVEVDEDKYFKKALYKLYPEKEQRTKEIYRNCFRIQDISNFVRLTLTPHTFKEVKDICEYFNVEYTDEIILQTIELLKVEKDVKSIDFTDMIYLPVVVEGMMNYKFDYVFLDEAQDSNECQFQFVSKLLSKQGRLITVGDEFQCIYGFIGNSSDIFKKIQKLPNTINLRLSVSYRCPKNIVKLASTVCDFIKPFEFSKEGEVRRGSYREIREGDFVLSRTTKPLIALFFQLLELKIKSSVIGKDIEKGLLQLADRCQHPSLEMTYKGFGKEFEKLKIELEELGVKSYINHQRWISLEEKIDVLKLILNHCDLSSELSSKVSEIFKESRESVKLMTFHRSKGLENDRVFIIEEFNRERLYPSKYAIKDWEKEQERNLEFVAYTRSKSELIFINVGDE